MLNSSRRFITVSLPTLAVSLVCASPLARRIVKFGVSTPLTGGTAANGRDIENGVGLALEEANGQHIKPGGQDVCFEPDSVGDEGEPRIGVRVVQRLADDGVAAVVGCDNPAVALRASPISAQAGVPLIDPVTTNPKITRRGSQNMFRLIATDAQNSGNAGKYAMTVTRAQRIAVRDDRTAFGQGAAEKLKKAVAAVGGHIAASEYTNDKAVEFNTQLTSVKVANADLLFDGGVDRPGRPCNEAAASTGHANPVCWERWHG